LNNVGEDGLMAFTDFGFRNLIRAIEEPGGGSGKPAGSQRRWAAEGRWRRSQVARITIAIAEFVGMTERAHLTKRGISRLHHRSTRMPLKNGCRTFLSSDDLGLFVHDCRRRCAKTAMKANKPIHRFRFDGWTMEAGSLRSHSSGHLFDSSTSEEHLYFPGDQCRTLGMPQNRL
jgi:hypothetical protein